MPYLRTFINQVVLTLRLVFHLNRPAKVRGYRLYVTFFGVFLPSPQMRPTKVRGYELIFSFFGRTIVRRKNIS